MKKHAGLFGFLAASTLSVLMAGAVAAAQESRSTASTTTARDQSSTTGIKVHGHWTIDLRNPDGTLASHNEFENACVACGQALGLILSRQGSVSWEVYLTGIPGPCESQGNPSSCLLMEVGTFVAPDVVGLLFPTLTLSTADATFTLNGNFVATFNGQIGDVTSRAHFNTAVGTLQFSQRTLGTPIQVAAGQQVYVTVTFSFS